GFSGERQSDLVFTTLVASDRFDSVSTAAWSPLLGGAGVGTVITVCVSPGGSSDLRMPPTDRSVTASSRSDTVFRGSRPSCRVGPPGLAGCSSDSTTGTATFIVGVSGREVGTAAGTSAGSGDGTGVGVRPVAPESRCGSDGAEKSAPELVRPDIDSPSDCA